MSIFWPDQPTDYRVPNPQTDVERMAYLNANDTYTRDKNSYMYGIAARLGLVAITGLFFLTRKSR